MTFNDYLIFVNIVLIIKLLNYQKREITVPGRKKTRNWQKQIRIFNVYFVLLILVFKQYLLFTFNLLQIIAFYRVFTNR